MAESWHETEDRTMRLGEANPDAGASPADPAAERVAAPDADNPVDEAKIAELLLEFERENEELRNGYPYWRRGVVWSFAASVVTAVVVYMLYAGSGTALRPVLGTAVLTLAVWVGTTFLPVKA